MLITGAAHGIGRATALGFARERAELELVDKDATALHQVEEQAREVGAPRVASHSADVSDPEAVRALAEHLHQRIDAVDVLVNNAGIAVVGSILETPRADFERLLSVNLMGAVHLIQALVPAMIRAGRGGQIVNLASAAGFVAMDGLGAYAATKHALMALSEALREELRPHRIGVTALCPGLVATGIADRLEVRGGVAETHTRARIRGMMDRLAVPPERVAEAVLASVREDPALLVVTQHARALHLLKRVAPGLLPRLLGRLAQAIS